MIFRNDGQNIYFKYILISSFIQYHFIQYSKILSLKIVNWERERGGLCVDCTVNLKIYWYSNVKKEKRQSENIKKNNREDNWNEQRKIFIGKIYQSQKNGSLCRNDFEQKKLVPWKTNNKYKRISTHNSLGEQLTTSIVTSLVLNSLSALSCWSHSEFYRETHNHLFKPKVCFAL